MPTATPSKPSSQTSRAAVFFALVLVGLFCVVSTQASTAARGGVDFTSEILPILEASCIECHGAKEDFSNLRLDSRAGIEKGGDLGKVLVPGKPDDSPLYVRVSLPQDDLDFMPVEGDGLTEEQIALLKTWIEEGADFGEWTGE
jgi:hypothetical protein